MHISTKVHNLHFVIVTLINTFDYIPTQNLSVHANIFLDFMFHSNVCGIHRPSIDHRKNQHLTLQTAQRKHHNI